MADPFDLERLRVNPADLQRKPKPKKWRPGAALRVLAYGRTAGRTLQCLRAGRGTASPIEVARLGGVGGVGACPGREGFAKVSTGYPATSLTGPIMSQSGT